MAAERLGMSIRTFYREVSLGNLPRGIPITDRTQGWRETAIDRIIADREAGIRSGVNVETEKRRPGRPRKNPISGVAD